MDSSSGVDAAVDVVIDFVSTKGDGEFARSLSAPKSAFNNSGRFLPLPLNRLAQDRSKKYSELYKKNELITIVARIINIDSF